MPPAEASPRNRMGRWPAFGAAITMFVLLAGAVIAWQLLEDPGPDASARSCSWPSEIHGANSDQARLVRCYLRALARQSESEMRAVVPSSDNGGPTKFTASDFAHTVDARNGRAIVTVEANDVDSADAAVTIRFADGAQETLEIHLANPASSHSWRFWNLGSYPDEPSAPAPVTR